MPSSEQPQQSGSESEVWATAPRRLCAPATGWKPMMTNEVIILGIFFTLRDAQYLRLISRHLPSFARSIQGKTLVAVISFLPTSDTTVCRQQTAVILNEVPWHTGVPWKTISDATRDYPSMPMSCCDRESNKMFFQVTIILWILLLPFREESNVVVYHAHETQVHFAESILNAQR